MFHAPMGRFQLKLIYCFIFHPRRIQYMLFLSCRPFVVITFSTGLVGVEVNSVPWLEVTSTPTRPVENVITTIGLQDRNNLYGTTVENKGKTIN
jgi:hypothetical protein